MLTRLDVKVKELEKLEGKALAALEEKGPGWRFALNRNDIRRSGPRFERVWLQSSG
jgi:hypothetical protein